MGYIIMLKFFVLVQDNLEKKLSLSESLANKNNEAAHSTAEQLLKANQIISKQNNDLIEIKEKVMCQKLKLLSSVN